MLKSLETLQKQAAINIALLSEKIYQQIMNEVQLSDSEKLMVICQTIDEKTGMDLFDQMENVMHLLNYSSSQFISELRVLGLELIENMRRETCVPLKK
jgi:hypothetical protein